MQKEQKMPVDKSSWLTSKTLLFKIYKNSIFNLHTQYIPLKILSTYSFEMVIGVNVLPSKIRFKSCPVREPKAAAYTHRSFVS